MPAQAGLPYYRFRFLSLVPWNSWKNYILIILIIVLLIRILSFPYAQAQFHSKRSSLYSQESEPPGIDGTVLSGGDTAPLLRPPTEELAGTPTVDKASEWRQAQSHKDAGAACIGGPCSSEVDGKSAVKRQIGSDNKKRPLGAITGTEQLSLQPNAPASTISTQPDGTQSAEPGLQTNVEESGEAKGVVRGVAWNSCASSAAMLVLVAIGVVVLL